MCSTPIRFVAVLVLSLLQGFAIAEDRSADADKQIEAKRQKRMQAFAASHDVRPSGSDQSAQLHDRPIIRWSNPTRGGSVGGAVHLWILQGRPVATIGLWTYKDTKDSYEYQSLCEQPLSARRDGRIVWNASKSGAQFRAVSESPKPAASAALRLIQMRRLARQRFTSTIAAGFDTGGAAAVAAPASLSLRRVSTRRHRRCCLLFCHRKQTPSPS